MFNTKQEIRFNENLIKNVSWICPIPDPFQDKFCREPCWVHKFCWEYKWTFVNDFMTNNEWKAFRRRLFLKYQKEYDFEYFFQIFDHMKDNFVDEKIGGWKKMINK